MAKFTIVLCAFIATVSAGPGLVGRLGGVPLAYEQILPYSSPLTYSASLAYTSPVAFGLGSSGSSRVDIQNNYNLLQPYAVPFAAGPYTASLPISYNVAQLAAPQTVPVDFGAPLTSAPVAAPSLAKFAGPVPFAAPQLIPASLRYSAPAISNFSPAFYGSQLHYTFAGQINAQPLATPLATAPGIPIAGQFDTSPVQLAADPSTAQTINMGTVPAENPEVDDSEEVPAKLVSKSAASTDDQKFATPAPVDGPQTDRDASRGSQSPIAPVMRSNNN